MWRFISTAVALMILSSSLLMRNISMADFNATNFNNAEDTSIQYYDDTYPEKGSNEPSFNATGSDTTTNSSINLVPQLGNHSNSSVFFTMIKRKFQEKCPYATVEDVIIELKLRKDPSIPRVRINLELLRINEINDLEQRISALIGVYYFWTLPCDPVRYYEIPGLAEVSKAQIQRTVYIENQQFRWYPGLSHVNAVKNIYFIESLTSQMHIHPMTDPPLGSIERVGVIELSCDGFSFATFPFDWLNCSFLLEVQYLTTEVLIDEEKTTFSLGSSYQLLGDTDVWFLAKPLNYTIVTAFNDVWNDSFQRIYFNMVFQRKPQYYISNIFVPTIILFLLQVSVLILDPALPDRSNYCITVVLALAVILSFITQLIPETSELVLLVVIIETKIGVCGVITFYTLLASTLARANVGRVLRRISFFGKFSISVIRLMDFGMFLASMITIAIIYAYCMRRMLSQQIA